MRAGTVLYVVGMSMLRAEFADTRLFISRMKTCVRTNVEMVHVKNFAHQSISVEYISRNIYNNTRTPELYWDQRNGVEFFGFNMLLIAEE